MFHVIELNSLQEMEPYRMLWHELESKTRTRHLFHACAWTQAVCQFSGGRYQPAVFIAMVDRYPIGILPLVRYQASTRLGHLNCLTSSVSGWGDHFSPVGPNPAATLHAVIRHLAQSPRAWEMLDLKDVDFTTYDKGRTKTAFRNAGWSMHERTWKSVATINLQQGWSDYWSRKRPAIRQSIQAQIHEVETLPWTFHRYRSSDSNHSEQLFERGINASRTLLVHSPIEQDSPLLAHNRGEFFETLWREADLRGEADLCWIELEGQPVAASIGLVCDTHLLVSRRLVTQNTVNQHVSAWKTLLMKQMLIDSADRGDLFCRLTGPIDSSVQQWMTGRLDTVRYTRFARLSLRSQLLNAWHRCRGVLEQGIELTRPRPQLPSPKTQVTANQPAAPAISSRPQLRLVGVDSER